MCFSKSLHLILIAFLISAGMGDLISAQEKKRSKLAVMRGKIAYDRERVKSWDGEKLVIPFEEIDAKLRARVSLPLPPYPKGYEKWNRNQLIQWEQEFIKTPAGETFLENRKKLIEQAPVFDIKFEKDGAFVIYDVPAGTYGIQGRTDRKIGDTNYGFEVFGQVSVLKEMEEIVLDPIRVEVTPLLQSGQVAPPVNVKTHNNQSSLSLEMDHFKGQLTFLNFWTAASPSSAAEQKMVQDMFMALKDKYDLRLLSINIDSDRDKVVKYIVDNQLRQGRHGFSSGIDQSTIFHYGVRSFPSFWLIGKDGKIKMSQFEIATLMRVKPSLEAIVADNIEGKDVPSPAPTPAKKDNSGGS